MKFKKESTAHLYSSASSLDREARIMPRNPKPPVAACDCGARRRSLAAALVAAARDEGIDDADEAPSRGRDEGALAECAAAMCVRAAAISRELGANWCADERCPPSMVLPPPRDDAADAMACILTAVADDDEAGDGRARDDDDAGSASAGAVSTSGTSSKNEDASSGDMPQSALRRGCRECCC